MRSDPLSVVNDPVCAFPWPDQDPSVRQKTPCFVSAGLGWKPHVVAKTAVAATTIVALIDPRLT